jgi:hypothetical protein
MSKTELLISPSAYLVVEASAPPMPSDYDTRDIEICHLTNLMLQNQELLLQNKKLQDLLKVETVPKRIKDLVQQNKDLARRNRDLVRKNKDLSSEKEELVSLHELDDDRLVADKMNKVLLASEKEASASLHELDKDKLNTDKNLAQYDDILLGGLSVAIIVFIILILCSIVPNTII